MLFNKVIFALTFLTGVAQAGQLRANTEDAAAPVARELTDTSARTGEGYDDGYHFFLESKAYANNYLGYKDDSYKQAWLKPEMIKWAYDKYWRLEKYDDKKATGKCYEMNDRYEVFLTGCDEYKVQQKWLVSEVPEYYGHYYTISNAYYGYVLEYDPSDYDYYLDSKSWKNVDYKDYSKVEKMLFYKESAYDKKTNYACRVANNGQGKEGKDYYLLEKGRDECKKVCSADHKCKAWEYSSSKGVPRCEIWYTKPANIESRSGFDCYFKHY